MATGGSARCHRPLALPDAPPLARIVHGIVLLRAGDAAAALPELEAGDPLAMAARAVALEKAGRVAEGRALLEALAANARTDAQRAWARARLATK